jgi:excisionase family DNA binding protein
VTDRYDVFGALLDQLAEAIAQRVVAKAEALQDEHAPAPDAYKVDQAARQLGGSAREVRRRIDAGELASARVGRAVIPRTAIETFLTSPNGSHPWAETPLPTRRARPVDRRLRPAANRTSWPSPPPCCRGDAASASAP